VQSVGDGTVMLESGEAIATETLVWAAGVTPNCLSGGLAAPRRPNGRLEVDTCLRLPGRERVFAIGDVAGCVQGGAELPLLAQPAMQAGRAVAENVLRDLRGHAPEPFRYKDPGIMATIGRNAGVALIRGIALKGWLGWVSWLGVHLFFIIGFRNRIAVLARWAWNYVFYDRPIRFIVREARRGVPHVRG
ncbi:MAG: FAD-dependent oxidoreductase, partial [Gemmatimonadota bacterium]|nr:FAD-dependent oxidoreductase [Gemmatimonadota bacterium]